MNIVAIDPGVHGAIVRYAGGECQVIKMPQTKKDIFNELRYVCEVEGIQECYFESVQPHVSGNNAVSSAKFANHIGGLEMALTALDIPIIRVTPKKWQRRFNLPADKSERKRRVRELMQERWPTIKVTLWNADALAILTWALDR